MGVQVCRRTSKVEGASARTSKLASVQGMKEQTSIRRAMSTPDVRELDTQLTVCVHEDRRPTKGCETRAPCVYRG